MAVSGMIPRQFQSWVTVALLAFTSPLAAQTSAKADVYAALFDGNEKKLESLANLVVTNVTIPMRTVNVAQSVSQWLQQWEAIPLALRRAAEQSAATTAALSPELFPQGTRFVTQAEVDSALVARGPSDDVWANFRRRFNAGGFLSVSDVVFSPDQSDALVYYEVRCGGLCGVGAYVWLSRDSSGSPWTIRRRIVSWVS
jgi:hypothetical protein